MTCTMGFAAITVLLFTRWMLRKMEKKVAQLKVSLTNVQTEQAQFATKADVGQTPSPNLAGQSLWAEDNMGDKAPVAPLEVQCQLAKRLDSPSRKLRA
eukprot:6179008-Prymnesium_polylepis.1